MTGVRVLAPAALAAAEVEAWAQFHAAQDLPNPFLSPAFGAAVARQRTDARVAVLRAAGEPVAFLPFQLGRFGIGRAMGLGVTDSQGLVAASSVDLASTISPPDLLRACGLAALEFDHLAADQSYLSRYALARFESPTIDLAQGFDTYLAALRARSGPSLQRMGTKERKLDREHGPLRFVYDADDPAALRALMDWKSEQYRRTGKPDHFVAGDWVRNLVADLAQVRTGGLTGTLSVLYAGVRPIAAHFGLRSERLLAWWFPGYDATFARYSPGAILLQRMLEAAAADGIRQVDLGRGETEYKRRYATGSTSVAEARVWRPSPAAVALYGYRGGSHHARALRARLRPAPTT